MMVQVVKITYLGTKSDNMCPLPLSTYSMIVLWARISKFVLMELHNDFCDAYSIHVKWARQIVLAYGLRPYTEQQSNTLTATSNVH